MSEIVVTAPYNGAYIDSLPSSSPAEVEMALSRAYALHRDRKCWLNKVDRLAILDKTAKIIASRREEIARTAAFEGGKPLNDSLIEVDRAIDGIKLCIEEIRTNGGSVIPMGLNATSAGRVAFTQYEPIGVVLAVSAFNHPFNLVVHQVVPAIAVGAPVIVKPAEATPLSCQTLIEILYEAGLPKDWAQMVLTDNHELTGNMVSDDRVGFFTFIGSAKVGWMLRSKLAPGARCALEHGGVAPVIIAADADLDMAAARVAHGGFWHAGQACVGVQRVFCERSIARELAEKLAGIGNEMAVGDPLLTSTKIGPLINNNECERVSQWVAEAVKGGAQLISGGNKIGESCYEATVLLDPPADARVTREEIFGPVICVYSYDDIDEAIQEANSLPFAFQAAVFSKSLDTAMRCYRHLDGTAVMVNESTLFRVDWMPFAGARQSGHGVGGIPHTIREMQTEKMMVWRSDELL